MAANQTEQTTIQPSDPNNSAQRSYGGDPSMAAKSQSIEHGEWVKSLLNRKMRIKVEGGCAYTGLFYCMDKQGNIYFKDAVLNIPGKADSYKYQVEPGVVTLIPFAIQKSIHMVIEEKSTVNLSAQPLVSEPATLTFKTPEENLPPEESLVIQPSATTYEPSTGNSSPKSLVSQPAVADPEPLVKSSLQSPISEPAATASKSLVESSPESLFSQPAAPAASVPLEKNLSPKSPVSQSAAIASEPLGEKSSPESLISQPDTTASEPLGKNSSPQFPVGEPAPATSEPPKSGRVNNFEVCIRTGYSGHVKVSFEAVPSEGGSSVGLSVIVRDDKNNILACKHRLEPKYLEPGEAQAHALRDALTFALVNEWKDMDFEFGFHELVNKLIRAKADSPVLREIKELRQGFIDYGWTCNISYTPAFRDTSTYYLAKNATRGPVEQPDPSPESLVSQSAAITSETPVENLSSQSIVSQSAATTSEPPKKNSFQCSVGSLAEKKKCIDAGFKTNQLLSIEKGLPPLTISDGSHSGCVKVSFEAYEEELQEVFGLGVVGQDDNETILDVHMNSMSCKDLKEEPEAYALRDALYFAKEKGWTNIELQSGYQELVSKVTKAESSDDGQVVKEIKEVLAEMNRSGTCRILYVSDLPNEDAFVCAQIASNSSVSLNFLRKWES